MIKAIALLLLFAQIINTGGYRKVFPSGAGVTYANNGCSIANNATLSLTCSITSNVTAGQTILLSVSEFNYPGALPVVTDTNTGTVSHLLGPTSFNGNGQDDAYLITNAGAGTHTITVTYNTTASFAFADVVVFSGASTTSPVDASVAGDVTSGTVCPNITTSSPAELLVTFASIGGGPTVAALSTPQIMSTPTAGIPFAYGTANLAGTNFVQWQPSAPSTFACDTIALH